MSNNIDMDLTKDLLVGEINITCPLCKKDAILSLYEYHLSLDESIVIMTIKCPNCGYKDNEIFSEGSKEYNMCIELKVENDVDLNTLIYINPGTMVELRDLGISIEIYQLDIGHIVTTEALILHIIDVIENTCIGSQDNTCAHIIEALNDVIKSKKSISIVLRDPKGVTRILKTYRESNYSFC
ncbi:ZPR1-type Zinc finger domain protein [Ignisphaera aggregans DSM 17230]|uniref:ZPR1-type Zinc finger domain protein n=1 Tax=Ignisphaera aggregans (strain DSM 17230 / JCM 13409 / AQ1.S1) TaxID=583356 RepID=E0SPS3_IGNAA|nr:ZPR1-type Zinc finger domain protein [Ignisphaera aggregans DSM 17230]